MREFFLEGVLVSCVGQDRADRNIITMKNMTVSFRPVYSWDFVQVREGN